MKVVRLGMYYITYHLPLPPTLPDWTGKAGRALASTDNLETIGSMFHSEAAATFMHLTRFPIPTPYKYAQVVIITS